MPRKRVAREPAENTIVTFNHNDRTYQIDTARRKVYRRCVEIETSRAVEIFAHWRAQNATA